MKFFTDAITFILIGVSVLMMLYVFGGEDIIFFRKKKQQYDPKSAEKLTAVLTKFARLRGYEVLGRKTLEYQGVQYTFDNIIIGFYGTVAFNVASHSGEIYGDTTSNKWVQIYDGKRYEFDSPTKALNGSVKMFKDIYRSEGVKSGLVDTMTIFTDKNANIAAARSLPICHVQDLAKKLDSSKYLADNGADLEAMKAALAKYTK
ncbi:MAG: nuclease-related domain-containing protein [Oscillospiraceae bacterium]